MISWNNTWIACMGDIIDIRDFYTRYPESMKQSFPVFDLEPLCVKRFEKDRNGIFIVTSVLTHIDKVLTEVIQEVAQVVHCDVAVRKQHLGPKISSSKYFDFQLLLSDPEQLKLLRLIYG